MAEELYERVALTAAPVLGHPSIQLKLTTVPGGQTTLADIVTSVAGPADGVVEDDATVVAGNLNLVPELRQLIDAPFANRPRVRVVRAEQPGRIVWDLPG